MDALLDAAEVETNGIPSGRATPWRHHLPDEIVKKLEYADGLIKRGATFDAAARSIGISRATLFRWRRMFGGVKIDYVRYMKELVLENARLRKIIEEYSK